MLGSTGPKGERKELHAWEEGGSQYRVVETPYGLAVEYRNTERGPGMEFWVELGDSRAYKALIAEFRRFLVPPAPAAPAAPPTTAEGLS
jgi:hypothetical protein